MKQKSFKLPLDNATTYIGPFDIEFKPGNDLANYWEVIRVSFLPDSQLAVYNRDLVI